MTVPVRIKTLKIDDRDVSAREDETILQVARENNIDIPSLCNLEGLSAVGACRLCMVEVEFQTAARLRHPCGRRHGGGDLLGTADKYRRMILS